MLCLQEAFRKIEESFLFSCLDGNDEHQRVVFCSEGGEEGLACPSNHCQKHIFLQDCSLMVCNTWTLEADTTRRLSGFIWHSLFRSWGHEEHRLQLGSLAHVRLLCALETLETPSKRKNWHVFLVGGYPLMILLHVSTIWQVPWWFDEADG